MLECQAASVAMGHGRRAKTLLHPVSLRLQPGRVTTVLGPNGAGKSTLLSLLSGQRPPQAGQVLLDGTRLDGIALPALALRRAVMPQEGSVAFDFSVRAVVELGRYPHRQQPSRREAEIVMEASALTDVAHLAERSVTSLSGGERARVHLARHPGPAVGARPDGAARWLLLDEPTAALDVAHQHQVMRTVRDWARSQGVGVVAVLHDLNLALRYGDDVLVLAQARQHCFGPVREVLTPTLVQTVWGTPCEPVTSSDGTPQYMFIA